MSTIVAAPRRLSCKVRRRSMRWGRGATAPLLISWVPGPLFSVNSPFHVLPLRGSPTFSSSRHGCSWSLLRHSILRRSPTPIADEETAPGAAIIRGSTRYTIDVDTHPDVESVALRHARQLSLYLERYPISMHTREAYAEAERFVREFYLQKELKSNGSLTADRYKWGTAMANKMYQNINRKEQSRPLQKPRYRVVLDSGCGTGRSTASIAKSFPNVPVLGVDRSAVRLSKSGKAWSSRNQWLDSRQEEQRKVIAGNHDHSSANEGGDVMKPARNDQNENFVMGNEVKERSMKTKFEVEADRNPDVMVKRGIQADVKQEKENIPKNMLLLRADLVDFWILASRDNAWIVDAHFFLYPNPYPKRSQLRRRWHGHPVFPVMLRLGGKITVRSNWRVYLEEMCLAVLAINNETKKGGEARTERLEHGGGQYQPPLDYHVDPGATAGRSTAANQEADLRSSARRGCSDLYSLGTRTEDEELSSGIAVSGMCREWETKNINVNKNRHVHGGEAKPTPVPEAITKVVVAYAASARKGPSVFVPSVPLSNSEAKYKAVGESMYELILEQSEDLP